MSRPWGSSGGEGVPFLARLLLSRGFNQRHGTHGEAVGAHLAGDAFLLEVHPEDSAAAASASDPSEPAANPSGPVRPQSLPAVSGEWSSEHPSVFSPIDISLAELPLRPDRVRFRSICGCVLLASGSSMIFRSSRSVPMLSVLSTRLKMGSGLLPPPPRVDVLPDPSERFDLVRFIFCNRMTAVSL